MILSDIIIKERYHLKLVLEFLADTFEKFVTLARIDGKTKTQLSCVSEFIIPTIPVAPGNPVFPLAYGCSCKPQLKKPRGDSASANLWVACPF